MEIDQVVEKEVVVGGDVHYVERIKEVPQIQEVIREVPKYFILESQIHL